MWKYLVYSMYLVMIVILFLIFINYFGFYYGKNFFFKDFYMFIGILFCVIIFNKYKDIINNVKIFENIC